jgi:hypothetical protein
MSTGGSTPTGGGGNDIGAGGSEISSAGADHGPSGNAGNGGGAPTDGGASTGGNAGTGGGKVGGGGAGTTVLGDGGQSDAPHTVGACNGLGNAGTWKLISPPAWSSSAKNEALSVMVNPQNPSMVFAAAGDKTNGGNGGTGIYRSTDCGATWMKISTGAHGADLETGDTWQLKMDPGSPQTLYATNGYGSPPSIFKSVNGGVDWSVLIPDGSELAKSVGGNFVQGFSIDPTDSQHLVLTFHFNCTGTYAPMCMAETKDGGTTWRAFKGPTGGWSEGGGPITLGSTTWLYASNGGLYFTKDSGGTWEKVSNNGGGSPYKLKDGSLLLGGDYGMLRSSDGHSWTQVPGAPKASGIMGDGTNLYAVYQNDYSGQPFHTEPKRAISSGRPCRLRTSNRGPTRSPTIPITTRSTPRAGEQDCGERSPLDALCEGTRHHPLCVVAGLRATSTTRASMSICSMSTASLSVDAPAKKTKKPICEIGYSHSASVSPGCNALIDLMQ